MDAVNLNVLLCSLLKSERKDRRDHGNVADLEAVMHVLTAAQVAIAHAERVRACSLERVAEQGAVALGDDPPLIVEELQRGFHFGGDLLGQNLHAELLAVLDGEAIEIDI